MLIVTALAACSEESCDSSFGWASYSSRKKMDESIEGDTWSDSGHSGRSTTPSLGRCGVRRPVIVKSMYATWSGVVIELARVHAVHGSRHMRRHCQYNIYSIQCVAQHKGVDKPALDKGVDKPALDVQYMCKTDGMYFSKQLVAHFQQMVSLGVSFLVDSLLRRVTSTSARLRWKSKCQRWRQDGLLLYRMLLVKKLNSKSLFKGKSGLRESMQPH